MSSPPTEPAAPALAAPSAALEAQIQALLDLIERHDRFVVAAHLHPDGDAVGSTLAMGHLLEQLGKQVVCYNRDPIPYNFSFLPGAARWRQKLPEGFEAQATILLDCAEPGRVGERLGEAGWGDEIAVIDHHRTWDADFADVYVRDVEAAATGELIYRVLMAVQGRLDADIARCLYCCLMTDTGSFRYSSTSQATFQIAGALVAAGVDAWEMTSHIYESQPLARLELLAEVLATLRVAAQGRLAFIRLERELLERAGGAELTDGFINYGRSVRGVEVATQLLELEDGSWKVSFRSRGAVNVSALAGKFGGGGHHNAAGCVMRGRPEQLEQELTEALEALLD